MERTEMQIMVDARVGGSVIYTCSCAFEEEKYIVLIAHMDLPNLMQILRIFFKNATLEDK